MKLKKKDLQIAIDGPVASGKSVAAFSLAKKLNLLYVYNTGAMYRAVAWLGLKHGLDLKKESALMELLAKAKIELKKPSEKARFCDVLVNGQEVTDQLFSARIHSSSSQVAVFAKVRAHLVELQKKLARGRAVVMEGRDITTVVLPKADLKVYMKADLQIRAQRRLADLRRIGEQVTYQEVLARIKKRDYRDTQRQVDPLKKSPDAWVLDTTDLTIDQEVDLIIAKLKKMDLVEA